MYRLYNHSKRSILIFLGLAVMLLIALPTSVMQADSEPGDPTPVDATKTAEPGTIPTKTPHATKTAEPEPGDKYVYGVVVLVENDLANDRKTEEFERQPVAKALVVAHRGDKQERVSALTNESGEYKLELAPGLWSITVHPTDQSDPSNWVYLREAQEVKFDYTSETERQEVNFVVVPASSVVFGKITLPNGTAPDFAVEIGLRNGEGVGGKFTTEPGNGGFEIHLPPGRYDILIHPKSDGYSGPNLEPIKVEPNQELDLGKIALIARSASVSGMVTTIDINGEGSTDESIGVAEIPVVAWSRENTAVVRTRTNEEGKYTLFLSPGKWHIQPAPGPKDPYIYLGEGHTVVLEDADQLADINFRVVPADGVIEGIVVTEDGEVAADLEGWAIAVNPNRPDVKVGAPIREGVFRMAVPRGKYTLTIEFSPGSPYTLVSRVNVEVGAGEAVEVRIPVKKRTERIVGALVDPRTDREVVTGVRGKVGGWMDDRWSATHIDPETGRYKLDVSEGIWQVDYKIDPEEYVKLRGARNIPVPVNQTVELPLPVTRKDAGISGTISDPEGNPVAGAIVIFDGISSEIAPLWLHTRTDENGNYRYALPYGKYHVGAVSSNRDWINPVKLTVEVEPNTVVEGVDMSFVAPNAKLIGRLEVPGAPESGNVLIFAWTERGGFAWTAAPVELGDNGSAVGDYELALAGDALWHVSAAFQSGNHFWNGFADAKVENEGTTTLNFVLEGPKVKPAPIVVTFDSSEPQRVELADGTSIFVPAGAMPVDGEVTLRIDPIATLPNQNGAKVVNYGYAIHATDSEGRPIEETFNQNVLIQFPFDRGDFRGAARNLKPAYFSTTTNTWTVPERFAVDLENKTVKMAIDHFTDFAILEGAAEVVYLPIITR